jgi:tetratricopeptide (TPR) repeat protein
MTRARRFMTIVVALHAAVLARGSAQTDDLASMIRRYIAYYDAGQFADAARVATEAIATGRKTLAVGSPMLAYLFRDLGEMQRSQRRYADAEQSYQQALSILQRGDRANGSDVALLYIELAEIRRLQGRFAAATDALQRARTTDETAVLRGSTFQGSSAGAATAGVAASLVNNVWDFYDRHNRERDDYGRYTYVLAPRASERGRQQALLNAVLTGTGWAERLEFDRRKLNVFYFPVQHDYQDAARRLATSRPDAAAGPIVASYYDSDFASELLSRLCGAVSSGVAPPGICKTDLSSGPYVVTLAKTLKQQESDPGPYLVVDLSNVHPDAFRRIVEQLKVQVRQPEFTDLQRVSQTRLELLSIILNMSETIKGVQSTMASLVEMVTPPSRRN